MFLKNVDASDIPRAGRLAFEISHVNLLAFGLLVLVGLVEVRPRDESDSIVTLLYSWLSLVAPLVSNWLLLPFVGLIRPIDVSNRARLNCAATKVSVYIFSVFGLFWVWAVTRYFF